MFGFHIIRERWKYNSDYNMYVSSLGHFKNKNKEDIYPAPQHNYLVFLINGKVIGAHIIVLKTFKPINDGNIYTVDHIDHNTRNNQLSNLRWMSRLNNSNDQVVAEFIENVKKAGVREFLQNGQIEEKIDFSSNDETSNKKYTYSLVWLQDKNKTYSNLNLKTAISIINEFCGSDKVQIKNDLKNFAKQGLTDKSKYGFHIRIALL